VLDPFVGGGTTVRAARKLGFNSIAVDMNKVALEVTQRAWEWPL
jgi:DNA modification methylase